MLRHLFGAADTVIKDLLRAIPQTQLLIFLAPVLKGILHISQPEGIKGTEKQYLSIGQFPIRPALVQMIHIHCRLIKTASPRQLQFLYRLMIQILHLRVIYMALVSRIHIQPDRFAIRCIPELPLRLDIFQFPYRMIQQALQDLPAKRFILHHLAKYKIIRNCQFLIPFCHSYSPHSFRRRMCWHLHRIKLPVSTMSSPTLLLSLGI